MAKRVKKKHGIIDGLLCLAVSIGSIHRAKKNPRDHDERSVEACRNSYKKYGQRKPLVVNKKNMEIEAGNGNHEAAEQMGWTHIAVVLVKDDPATARGYRIADNRTAELSRWNIELLHADLERLEKDGMDIEIDAGFTKVELEELPMMDYSDFSGQDEVSGRGSEGRASGDAPGSDGLTLVVLEFITEDYQLFVEAMRAEDVAYRSTSRKTQYGLKLASVLRRAKDAGVIG